MSLLFLNHKTIIEAKKTINQIIAQRNAEGYEYPSSLYACDKLNVKFSVQVNAQTMERMDCLYLEWLVPKLPLTLNQVKCESKSDLEEEEEQKANIQNHNDDDDDERERCDDVEDEDEDDGDKLDETEEFYAFHEKRLTDYLRLHNVADYLIAYCVQAMIKCTDKIFDMTLILKTDFIEHATDIKSLRLKQISCVPSVENDTHWVYYESDQHYADSVFEQLTAICFGTRMNKLGCEYTLFWQHAYKSVFRPFAQDDGDDDDQQNDDDDDDDHDYYDGDGNDGDHDNQHSRGDDYHHTNKHRSEDCDSADYPRQDRANLDHEKKHLYANQVKIEDAENNNNKSKKNNKTENNKKKKKKKQKQKQNTTTNVTSSRELRKKLLEQPNMNKIAVRKQKYRELANTMKKYIFLSDKQGRLVHNLKSPCPLRCVECSYDVKRERFTFVYCVDNDYFTVNMDPLEGSIMVQNYTDKIVQMMD